MADRYRDKACEARAITAVDWSIRREFRLSKEHKIHIGLVLGTGWGDALNVEDSQEMSFSDIIGFESLGKLKGHARRLVYGKIAGREVLALRGRVHLNEGHGEDTVRMVRLQTEMLFQMGVDTLIVTSAVGSLVPRLPVGNIAVVRSFITGHAPAMPMYVGEFYSPEDMLDDKLNDLAMLTCHDTKLNYGFAVHVMVRGPFFEGRKNDKRIFREEGADVIGMSMLPEACVASVYGVKVIGLSFITNDAVEEHSHEENVARVKESQAKLGVLLTDLVRRLPEKT